MKKYVGILVIALFIGALVAAEILVPDSVQIYMAGVAGCEFDEEKIASNDADFEELKFWEPSLSRYYRLREWVMGGDPVIVDDVAGTISPYHALLTAHGRYGALCDTNIRALFQRYIDQGVPVNQISSLGCTPLHEAVIVKSVELVKLLMQAQADVSLPVQSEDSQTKGMTALEIAQLFESKNDDANIQLILGLLNHKR